MVVVCGASEVQINVVFVLLLPLSGAFGAGVLHNQVLLRVWIPDDLTLVEFARRRSHGEWVVIGAITPRDIAAAFTVVGCSWTWWRIIRV